ncbi:hypothetical protein K505DRAFT_378047, partial [Melanomma pulvis-pyrius CBS 109.77]
VGVAVAGLGAASSLRASTQPRVAQPSSIPRLSRRPLAASHGHASLHWGCVRAPIAAAARVRRWGQTFLPDTPRPAAVLWPYCCQIDRSQAEAWRRRSPAYPQPLPLRIHLRETEARKHPADTQQTPSSRSPDAGVHVQAFIKSPTPTPVAPRQSSQRRHAL